MSWKMVGKPNVRKLTPAIAKEFSGMAPAPHDRPLNAVRCSVLRAAFDKGRFRTCEWATAYCAETKQTYRLNGKHTSTILSSMNGHFPTNLSVIVETYHCDTLEDVAALYSTFDPRGSARSTGDINLVYAASVPELEGIPSKVINLVVTGMAYSVDESGYIQKLPEERAAMLVKEPSFCVWVNELVGGFKNSELNHLKRSPVVAAIYKTWQRSKSAAQEFWTEVKNESAPKPDAPTRKLSKFLITSRLSARKSVDVKSVGSRETFVKCLHAWNAWRAGESTDLKFFMTAKTPVCK